MSAILNDVASYMEGQIVELVKGTTLFRDRLPATLLSAVAIMERSNKMDGTTKRDFFKVADVPNYRVRSSDITVHVRKQGKIDSETLAGQINALLINLDTDVFSNFRLNRVQYVSGPTFFPEVLVINGSRTYTFTSSFVVYYEDVTTTSIA